MSIQKHEGKWQVRIRRKGYPQQTKSFTYKADAEAWEHQILTEMERGAFAASRTEAERTTLQELLQRYLDECVPKLASPQREGTRVKALMRRDIAQRYLASIRSADIAAFIREREGEGVAGNTVRLDVAVISRVFNLAKAEWGYESLGNPTEHVRRPKSGKRERRLEEGEEEKLLAAAADNFRPCVEFALETAMRREEIASLDWKHVNIESRSALLPKTKNGEQRTVPLSPKAIEILAAIGPQEEGSVFGLSASAITQAMDAARRRARIEDLHFHDLRHEATSRLFERTDLDFEEVRSITGHKSLQMLARYSHLRTSHLANRLAGAKRGDG